MAVLRPCRGGPDRKALSGTGIEGGPALEAKIAADIAAAGIGVAAEAEIDAAGGEFLLSETNIYFKLFRHPFWFARSELASYVLAFAHLGAREAADIKVSCLHTF